MSEKCKSLSSTIPNLLSYGKLIFSRFDEVFVKFRRPLSKRCLTMTRCPSVTAQCSAVLPCSSLNSRLAPRSKRAWTMDRCPWQDATCRGVFPSLFLASMFEPFSMRNFVVDLWPSKADTCKAVSPASFSISRFDPCFTRSLTTGNEPFFEALKNGIKNLLRMIIFLYSLKCLDSKGL